jgi:CBS domain-containing protein
MSSNEETTETLEMNDTQTVSEVMTKCPQTPSGSASVREAAEFMQRSGAGATIVAEGGKLLGIVIDRDIVVRCVAEGRNADDTRLAAICSNYLATLSPVDDVDHAVALMRKKANRRTFVVEEGRVGGILSLGDLEQQRSPHSALGGISSARPNP